MTPIEAISLAHKASGATVTELANATGIGRARLGEWLSRANPNAKPRRVVYAPPSPVEVRAVVEVAVLLARKNLAAVMELLAKLDAPA